MLQNIFLDDDGITKVTTSAENKKWLVKRKGKCCGVLVSYMLQKIL